jgi:tetratricopeptide (TPR) repeat protein
MTAATRRLCAVPVAWLLGSLAASAIFVSPEIRQVPVARLLDNLERELKTDPNNAGTLVNIARLHAMAFALKSEEVPAAEIAKEGVKEGEKERKETIYFPPGSGVAPPAVKDAVSREHAARAAQHLEEAIRHYEAALVRDPDNLTARLGHGWVLQQAGRTRDAIHEYRAVVKSAWATEQNVKRLMPGQRLFTQEAIVYLMPLLDPTTDAAEIDDLRVKRQAIDSKPRAITPIAIPLADDLPARALLDPLAHVRFDADGSALDREWTWITPRAGWLVYDADGGGRITSALQLFGNATFWLFWANGYEALRALDDDGDGELAGRELDKLAIWRDSHADGIADGGEVAPLAAYGIAALSCAYLKGDGQVHAAMSPRGVRFADGRTRPTYDLILRHASMTLTRASR